jgi:hypothetical protein
MRAIALVVSRAKRELPFKNLPSVLILKPFSVWFSKASSSQRFYFPVLPFFFPFGCSYITKSSSKYTTESSAAR